MDMDMERFKKQLEFILEIDAGDTYAYDKANLKHKKSEEKYNGTI